MSSEALLKAGNTVNHEKVPNNFLGEVSSISRAYFPHKIDFVAWILRKTMQMESQILKGARKIPVKSTIGIPEQN